MHYWLLFSPCISKSKRRDVYWMCLSLQILFVYFLILPSLLHPSIYSIVFILVSILFFIAFSVIHRYYLTWFAHSTPVYFDSQVPKFARVQKISSHAPTPRQADKEAVQVAMTLFLTQAEGPPEECMLLEPSYS